MKNKIISKYILLFMAGVLASGMITDFKPVTTYAAGVEIVMDKPALSRYLGMPITVGYRSVAAPSVPAAEVTRVGFGGVGWYVIGYKGKGIESRVDSNTITLLSENSLGYSKFCNFGDTSRYDISLLKNAMESLYTNGYDSGGFSMDGREKSIIKTRDLPDDYHWALQYIYTSENTKGQYFWPLDYAESNNSISRDILKSISEGWSLREAGTDDKAIYIDDTGAPNDYFAYNSLAVRPALKLDLSSVAFTSAAAGGKSSVVDSNLTAAIPLGNALKFTIKDNTSLSLAITNRNVRTANQGDIIAIDYSNAKLGTGRYVSCVITNTDGLKYYGKLVDTSTTNENGTALIEIPADMPTGSYTIKMFNEEISGDNKTDYCSEPIDIALTVHAPISITTQPQDQIATEGTSVIFSANASGNPAPTYQWQESTDGTTWAEVIGETADTLILSNITLLQNGYKYRLVASNGISADVTSLAATLTVTTAHSIVNIADILGVRAPVKGEYPVPIIVETNQYSGTVVWSPTENPFEANTVYTATITLAAKLGYSLTGIPANFFAVAGANSVSNAANSGEIKAAFPETTTSLERESIAITTLPTKLIYTVGDLLDISGMVVTATYSDNPTRIETVTTSDVSGFDSSVPSACQVMTVTVGMKTVTFEVIINAVPISTYTVTFDSLGGSSVPAIYGAAPSSKISAPDAPIKSGYTFADWYKEPSCKNAWNFSVDTIVGSTTLYAKWTYSGRNGGGYSSAPAKQPQPVAQVLDSNGNVMESIPFRQDNGTGTILVQVATDSLTSVLDKSIIDDKGVKTAVIDIPKIDRAKRYELTLEASVLNTTDVSKAIKIKTNIGVITVPCNMLVTTDTTGAQNVSLIIAAGDKNNLDAAIQAQIGDRPIIELNLKIDGKQVPWSNENASVTIAVAYKPTADELKDPEHIVVWYIDGSGKAVSVPSGRYDSISGTVTFTTTHFSCYAIAFVHKTFSDLEGVEWAKKPIEVLASKGIFEGTSDKKYSPQSDITRADFLCFLVRILGVDSRFDVTFDDISSHDYYYKEIGIAQKLGITNGIGNNKYNPNASITRQDMMVLTVRALEKFKALKTSGDTAGIDKFSDKGDIAGYAAESLATLVKEGLISGTGNMLNPHKQTTRAEAAMFLYRIYNK